GRTTTSSVQSMGGHYLPGTMAAGSRSVRPAATATAGAEYDARDGEDEPDNDAHQDNRVVDGGWRMGRDLNVRRRRVGRRSGQR
ncbi:MAG TPA: hypothetical protein VNB91_08435, partial [Jatrophihabitantaceae bacterium]|nr:hypothetical protein [Jatrophihabitantaceae bacterium]